MIKVSKKALTFLSLLVVLASCANSSTSIESTAVNSQVISLKTADNRDVPLRAIYPVSSKESLGVILFSHGAFSDYDLYDKVLEPWAARGYLVLAIRHIDSPQNPLNKAYPQSQQWRLRLEDMQTSVAAIVGIGQELKNVSVKVNPERLIVAGHSYGAITALAMAGAKTYDLASGKAIDKIDLAPRAVIAMSPPGLIPKYIEDDAFADLTIPTLVQTGTNDVLENFIPSWEMHRAAYDLSPAGYKVLAIGKNVDHYFGGLTGRFDVPGEPQTQALEAFIALSIDFISAFETDNKAAAERLLKAGKSGQWSEHITVEIR